MKECSENLSETVIGCAIEVHRTLGAGLLENTYEKCLAYELSAKGIPFIVQAPIPIQYKNIKLECGYRLDFLVDECLILELKEPLINYILSLACRRVRNQGASLKACLLPGESL